MRFSWGRAEAPVGAVAEGPDVSSVRAGPGGSSWMGGASLEEAGHRVGVWTGTGLEGRSSDAIPARLGLVTEKSPSESRGREGRGSSALQLGVVLSRRFSVSHLFSLPACSATASGSLLCTSSLGCFSTSLLNVPSAPAPQTSCTLRS